MHGRGQFLNIFLPFVGCQGGQRCGVGDSSPSSDLIQTIEVNAEVE